MDLLVAPLHAAVPRLRARAERGATVVEMIVATFLLAVGVLAVTASLRTASLASAVADHRATADRIADSELEIARSLDPDVVGIERSAPGYVPRFEGRATVTGVVNRVLPRGSTARGGITFDIERAVTWVGVDTVAGHDPQGYKQVTVIVSWTDDAGPHVTRRDTPILASALASSP